jgi:hypothetical protein
MAMVCIFYRQGAYVVSGLAGPTADITVRLPVFALRAMARPRRSSIEDDRERRREGGRYVL